jgi:hypothetical protein
MSYDFAMYSEAGNAAVLDLCVYAKTNGLSWGNVCDQLEDLSRLEDFGEATDTEVRECVWTYLGFN